jgi:hypothetical protein
MRGDLHAPAIYEFLGASLDEQISVPIDRADIAGAEPASREALLIDGWIADVTRDDVATADDDFALAIRSERSAQLIPNSDVRPGRYTDRARLANGGGSGLQAIWWAASVMP